MLSPLSSISPPAPPAASTAPTSLSFVDIHDLNLFELDHLHLYHERCHERLTLLHEDVLKIHRCQHRICNRWSSSTGSIGMFKGSVTQIFLRIGTNHRGFQKKYFKYESKMGS